MTIKGRIYIPIFYSKINIVVSDNINLVYRNLCRKYESKVEDLGTGDGYSVNFNEFCAGHYYLFFVKNKLDVATFNHEKSHIIEYILKDCGISPTNEVRSYLDGYVSEQLDKWFKRRKIKLKSEIR